MPFSMSQFTWRSSHAKSHLPGSGSSFAQPACRRTRAMPSGGMYSLKFSKSPYSRGSISQPSARRDGPISRAERGTSVPIRSIIGSSVVCTRSCASSIIGLATSAIGARTIIIPITFIVSSPSI